MNNPESPVADQDEDDEEREKKLTKPPHEPTEKIRERVQTMAKVGIPQDDIAIVFGIDPKTLRKYYREELDTAAIIANTAVGGKLYGKCMAGDTTSLIFWAKTRMGYRETVLNEHTGKNGGPVEYTRIERVIVSPENTNP